MQLLRLRPAFVDCEIIYATVQEGYRAQVEGAPFHVIPDANRWDKLSLMKCAVFTFLLLVKLRPDVVITTGAAPGYFAVRIARLLGSRTIWLDSVANAEELSLSGKMAEGQVDLWMTQWEHLSGENGPEFHGRIL